MEGIFLDGNILSVVCVTKTVLFGMAHVWAKPHPVLSSCRHVMISIWLLQIVVMHVDADAEENAAINPELEVRATACCPLCLHRDSHPGSELVSNTGWVAYRKESSLMSFCFLVKACTQHCW